MSTIQLRRGTTSQWATANPVLAAGEPGWDTTVGRLKVGNGTSTWTALPYETPGVGDAVDSTQLAAATGSIVAAVVGDGVADDTAAVQAALDAANGKLVRFPLGSVCRISGLVVADATVRLDLTGTTLVQTANAPILKATSTPTNVLAVSATTAEAHTMPGGVTDTQTTKLTVSATTGYAKGDLIRIVSGDPIPGSNPSGGSFRPRQGEFARVGDLDSTHIWLAGPLRDTYATNVKVYRVPAYTLSIEGGALDFDDALDGVSAPGLLELNGYRHVAMSDTFIKRALAAAITTQGCASGTYRGVRSEKGRNLQPSNLGYGIVHLGSEHQSHFDCHLDNFRHGFTTGGAFVGNDPATTPYRFGRTAHLTYVGCSADGCLGAGFDNHEEALDVTYVGCSVNGSQQVGDAGGSAFSSRGGDVRYFGCHAEGGLTGWQIFSLYGLTSKNTLINGCSSRVTGAPITAIGNVAGTAGGNAYSAGTVEKVRVTNSPGLVSTTGAAWVVNRAQVAVDGDIPWTTGSIVSASPDVRPAYLGPVATRGRIPSRTVASSTFKQTMTWSRHTATDDITALQLLYSSINGIGEVSNSAGPGTVHAAVEYPVGTITPVTFDGAATSGTIPVNDHMTSDFVTLLARIPAKAVFWVGTHVNWTGTNTPLMDDGLDPALAPANTREATAMSGTTVTDSTLTGTRTATGHNPMNSYRPTMILGMTQRPTFALVGDSRTRENLSWETTIDAEGLRGLTEMVLGGRWGYVNLGVSTDSYTNALSGTGNNYAKRLLLAAYCTHVLDDYGTNSVQVVSTAQMQTDITNFRAKFPGKPYWKTTIQGQVTGRPVLADGSDQTVSGTLANLVAHNTYVRQGAGGVIDGYIEIEDILSLRRDSGKWKTAERVVTDAAMTAGSNVLTSATAAFTTADVGKIVYVTGVGAAGAAIAAIISATGLTSTSVQLLNAGSTSAGVMNATTTASAQTLGIGTYTADGIHQTREADKAIRDSNAYRPLVGIR